MVQLGDRDTTIRAERTLRSFWWVISGGVVALTAGRVAASGFAVPLLSISALGTSTAFLPEIVPAILVVGAGLLKTLVALGGGSATRGDVLASPLLFLPLLAVLFVVPVVRAHLKHGRLFPADFFGWTSRRFRLAVGMVVLLGILSIGMIGTPTPIYGLTKTVGFAAYSLAPALLVFITVRSQRGLERVVAATFYVGVATIGFALASAAAAGNLNLYYDFLQEEVGGGSLSGAGLGAIGCFVALIGIGRMIAERRTHLLMMVGVLLGVAAIVLAGNRASGAAFACGLATLTVIGLARSAGNGHRVRLRTSVALLLVVGASMMAWNFAPPSLLERYENPLRSGSFVRRVQDQETALQGWRDAPIFGNGTGSSTYLIAGADQPAFGIVLGFHPHNVTVELLAETGLAGTTVYLLSTLGLAFAGYRRSGRAAEGSRLLPTLVALAVAAFVVAQGEADLTIHKELWILSALLAVGIDLWAQRQEAEE